MIVTIVVRALCHSLEAPPVHLPHERSILGVTKVLWNDLFFKLKRKKTRVRHVLSKTTQNSNQYKQDLQPLVSRLSTSVHVAAM